MNSIDISWARKHLAGFAKMQDNVLAVKASEAEYAKLKNVGKEPMLSDLSRSPHPFNPLGVAQHRRDVKQRAARRIWKRTCESLFNKLVNSTKDSITIR